MTIQEFWEFCNRRENAEHRLELICGEVVEWPMPYHKHGVVCATVGTFLTEFALRSRTGYVVGANAGIIFAGAPASVVGPDVAFFAAITPDEEPVTGWSQSPPILAVEVLAPNEDFHWVAVKVEEYLRNGVEYVWLIDYERKTGTISRPGTGPAVFDQESVITGEGGLSGLSLEVCDLFRLPAERARRLS